jgi:hypothetical protein
LVQAAYPDAVEVQYQRKDSNSNINSTRDTGKAQYQIPSATFFRQKRRVLLPLCNILSLMAINNSDRSHGLHDASPKGGYEAFCTSACIEKDGKVITVPVGLCVSADGKAATEAAAVEAALTTTAGGGVTVPLTKFVS